jgi:hypothetical protein
MPKKCFVIGPIGDAGSKIRTAADAFMNYIVEPTLGRFDYEKPQRADTLGEPGRITSQIVTLLMEADLVIADLTGNNPNVYYELSLRHALGKPAIHMAESGTILPFDLHDNRTIPYTMDIRDVNVAKHELAKQIVRVNEEGYQASNPITETLGIIELSRSDNPTARTLSTILQSVEALSAEVHQLKITQSLAHFREMAMPSTWGGFGSLGQPYDGQNALAGLLAAAASRLPQPAADASDTPPVLKAATERARKREQPKE